MSDYFNVTHNAQMAAAKEYCVGKSADYFNPFLDGAQWVLRQLVGRTIVSMDGWKLEVRHGHIVYNMFQKFNECIGWGPEDKSDPELNRLYEEKENVRHALHLKEAALREYIQSKSIK